MRYPGIWLRILAACAVATLAADLSSAQAQTGPAPPGAVGMDNGPVKSNADPVVAVVNTNSIHLSDVGDAIRTMPGGGAGNSFEALYPAVLRGLIAREALLIKARAAGVAEDPAVRRHMQAAADQVLINAYLQRETTKLVTDQTLTERYDAEIQGKPGPEEVHGQVILVKTEAEAQDIIAKLAAGADFATLARQSGNDSIARIGGDIGFVRREGLAPEVAAVLFALRPGEVTPFPVRTGIGWFVLRVEARRFAPTPTFSEARDHLQSESAAGEVPVVMKAAVNGLAVRTYDMTGH
jgi:peptidyl-prolyl cis-trans isomerase C